MYVNETTPIKSTNDANLVLATDWPAQVSRDSKSGYARKKDQKCAPAPELAHRL